MFGWSPGSLPVPWITSKTSDESLHFGSLCCPPFLIEWVKLVIYIFHISYLMILGTLWINQSDHSFRNEIFKNLLLGTFHHLIPTKPNSSWLPGHSSSSYNCETDIEFGRVAWILKLSHIDHRWEEMIYVRSYLSCG